MRRIFFTVCALTGWMHPSPVFADTTTDSDTVLDPSPFVSIRANAMGGALSTIADDTDALYYNPAGIGGLGFDNKQERMPFFRSLLFPYVGASANKNAISVQKQLSASSAQWLT